MMMHKPHFLEIMTENLGGGHGGDRKETGVLGSKGQETEDGTLVRVKGLGAKGTEANGKAEGAKVQDQVFL